MMLLGFQVEENFYVFFLV